MRKHLRALALGCALALTPACASTQTGQPLVENPLSAAQTIDQRAYALLQSYAAVIEEATDVVNDPAVPLAFKRALGNAERAATPAAETLEIAVRGYVRARSEFDAATSADQAALERAAAALAIAARHVHEAVQAARAPVTELHELVRARRG
ncbi:MAG: hypothetical protein AB7O04_07615 [Hyphomonadaceae bacterium]